MEKTWHIGDQVMLPCSLDCSIHARSFYFNGYNHILCHTGSRNNILFLGCTFKKLVRGANWWRFEISTLSLNFSSKTGTSAYLAWLKKLLYREMNNLSRVLYFGFVPHAVTFNIKKHSMCNKTVFGKDITYIINN